MPGISTHYDIRCAGANYIIGAIGSGNVYLQGLSVDNVKVRMMPRAMENINPLPCIVVAPFGDISWEPMSFENDIDRVYMVEYGLIAAGNQDYATNQEKYEGWLDAIAKLVTGDAETLFCNASPPVTTIWMVEISNSRTFERGWLNQNYAYQSIFARYHSQESRDYTHAFPFNGN